MQSTEMEGDQPKAAEPAAEAGPKTQEVKLSVQDGGRWQPWVEGILNERFQAKYPNGEVVFTPRTGGQAHTFVELSVGLAAGVMPDLFKMGQAIAPSIYMAGLSIPLNSYFAHVGHGVGLPAQHAGHRPRQRSVARHAHDGSQSLLLDPR